MAIRSRVVSVTTTATALNDLAATGSDDRTAGAAATIYNNGSATVFVGGADVTTATGIPLVPTAAIDIESGDTWTSTTDADILYGRVATGTTEVIVLEVGVIPA